MTTKQTLQALAAGGKIISLGRLYVYLNRLGIKPAGANQRPQQYPPDTAERILAHLGFSSGRDVTTTVANGKSRNGSAGILTLKQLKRGARRTTKGTK
jgi:hypothetical protein